MTNWTDGEILGFDLETTSVDPYTALPVSYAFVRFEGGEVVEETKNYVNPGVPIPPETTAIHGITDEMASNGWELYPAVAWMAGLIRGNADRGIPLAGMNLAYDLTVIDSCARRGTGLDFTLGNPAPVVDLLILDKHVDKFRKGKRTLSDLALHYGVELGDDAHDASADVVASVHCIRELARRYPAIQGADLRILHESQQRWNLEQKRSLSQYFVRQGGDAIPECQMEWPVFGHPETVPA